MHVLCVTRVDHFFPFFFLPPPPAPVGVDIVEPCVIPVPILRLAPFFLA